ncbi:MAG: hypothetical protein PHG67_13915 [Bacteroidales bacterium]|jgi:hypothetical protein|nr:hypothetical protein [Bacteroidales bacterium]
MNKKLEYLFNTNKLQSDLNGLVEEDISNPIVWRDFLIVSANIYRYLPDIKPKRYFNLAKEILFYNQLVVLDQRYFFLLDEIQIIDEKLCLDELRESSYIITTYHTGSYRLIIPFLLKEKIKFVLVTDEKFIHDQGKGIHELQKTLLKSLNATDSKPLEIISAQDVLLLMKLRDKIEKGYSVVFYIDGNTGLFKYNINENKLLKIPFLADYIYVRKGIAFLSYLTKTRIISFLSERQTDLSNTIHIEPVECDFSMNRNDFIKVTTSKLYSALENFLKEMPTQWEGWKYLNEFNQEKTDEPIKNRILVKDLIGQKLIYNERKFKLIKIPEGFYSVNYEGFQVIEITELIFSVLLFFTSARKINQKPIIFNNERISLTVLKELFNLNYLIYV